METLMMLAISPPQCITNRHRQHIFPYPCRSDIVLARLWTRVLLVTKVSSEVACIALGDRNDCEK